MAGRVSDILRSYVVQALFKRIGIHLGFLPRPIVVQDRNPHSYEADFNAEIPLYTKSSFLVSYLIQNYVNESILKSSGSLIEIIESIWIDMYERGFVEEDDVLNIQEWISDLVKIGYKFPSILQNVTTSSKDITLNNYRVLKYTKNSKLIKNIISVGRKINVINKQSVQIYDSESDINRCMNHLNNYTVLGKGRIFCSKFGSSLQYGIFVLARSDPNPTCL